MPKARIEPRKLDDRFVDSIGAAADGTRDTYPDTLSPVRLRVTDQAAKSWIVNGRIRGGEAIKVTLGNYPRMTLAKAREAARAAAERMDRGEDPRLAEKRARDERKRRDSDTFKAVAEDFITKHLAKNRTGARDEKLIRRDLIPEWGALPVRDITRRDVADLLDKVAVQRKGKAGRKIGGKIAANRRASTIRKIFNWCLARGMVDFNPAARMERIGQERARKRVLSPYELRMIWRAADTIGGAYGAAVKTLMLTLKRRTEVARMRRHLVDRQSNRFPNVWTSQAEDEKSKVEHLIPLSDPVIEIIDGLPRIGQDSEWFFTTTGKTPISGWSKGKKALDAKIAELVAKDAAESGEKPEPVAGWVLHDLRRTASTMMGDVLKIPEADIKRVLNHTDSSVTRQHYNLAEYLEEKRHALDAWARLLASIVEGTAPSNVIPLRRTSA